MKIKVTNSHIQHGSPLLCGSCPIALALTEYGFIYVNVSKTKLIHGFPYITVDLPLEAIEFIKSFDSGQVVKPFEFKI